MKFITTMLLGASLLITSCSKNEGSLIENQSGTIQTSSSSACNLFILLDSGLKIDPVNRGKMEAFLVNGKRVTVSYKITKDYVTTCEGATTVIVEDIR